MLRNRIFYILLLVAVGTLYLFTNTYYTLLFAVVVLLLPMISFLLAFISRNGLSVSLDLPLSMEKEGNTSFAYHFANHSALPIGRIGFTVKMENQLTFTQNRQKAWASVGGKTVETLELKLESPRVGGTLFETTDIRIYDVLGLFSFKKSAPEEKRTVVYPVLEDYPIEMGKPIETMGESLRYAPDKPGGDVSEIFSLREYVPGDEVRKIHWKLSSKLDKMIVREFSMPLNYSIFLMLELVRDRADIMEKSVETFLAISETLLRSGINHNLAWYDGGEEKFHVRELDTFEDFETAMAAMLTSYAYERPCTALDHYLTGHYINRAMNLIYVASRPDEEKLLELAEYQPTTVIGIPADHEGGASEADRTEHRAGRGPIHSGEAKP